MVSLHYFMESNSYTPGMLTDLRSFVTNNNALGALAVKCGIHSHIKNLVGLPLAEVEAFALTQLMNGHPLPNNVSGTQLVNSAHWLHTHTHQGREGTRAYTQMPAYPVC